LRCWRASFAGEYAIQLLDKRQKSLVVVLDRDPRTEFVNPVAFFPGHANGSITGLAHRSMFGVERMMDTGEYRLPGQNILTGMAHPGAFLRNAIGVLEGFCSPAAARIIFVVFQRISSARIVGAEPNEESNP
jgi:hypothetical protein